MKILIREAKKDDIKEILILWRQLIDFHSNLDKRMKFAEDGEKKFGEFVDECINTDDKGVFVAEKDNKIIGFIVGAIWERPVLLPKRYGHITDMCVDENHRRKGIGAKLFNAIKKWFKSNDIKVIQVNMSILNKISTKFWKKTGFEDYLKVMWYYEI